MSGHESPFYAEVPIPARILGSHPQPAVFGYKNLGPKGEFAFSGGVLSWHKYIVSRMEVEAVG